MYILFDFFGRMDVPKHTGETQLMKLKILYEDKYIIVCNKPAGVSSQTERSFDPDMISILMNHLHESGVEQPYVGVIHRLDKPVSGVMVYAKTKEAAASLSKELAEHSFSKRYYAIVMADESSVNGTTNSTNKFIQKLGDQGTLENYLLHDVKSNSSTVVDCSADQNNSTITNKNAKLAKLNYTLLNQLTIDGINLALLDIELLTGRHHQIRVQLSHAGCPILGDMKYNKNMQEKLPYKIKKVGLTLCAYSLTFKHPKTGEVMSFTDMPEGKLWDELAK